jgi:xylulokinase
MLSAASCNKWWMDDILKTKDYAGEQQEVFEQKEERLGSNDVFFLPYLMGERSPHNDPSARGAFIGMRMDTTREQMTQAVMEGVAFALRDSYEVAKAQGIQMEKTRICGGGAKSELWRTIVANVLNLTVETPEIEEGPAMGGAMLAAVGCGVFRDVAEAAEQIVRVKETLAPDPELAARYEEKYQIFRRLYPALKGI